MLIVKVFLIIATALLALVIHRAGVARSLRAIGAGNLERCCGMGARKGWSSDCHSAAGLEMSDEIEGRGGMTVHDPLTRLVQ